MYPGAGVIGVLEIVGLGWILILSYFFWRQYKRFNQLFPGSDKEAKDGALLIRDRLEKILASLEEVKRREEVLKKAFREMSLDNLGHLQKVSLLRYNPYGDTGGEMSFSVCLLDGKDNGLILTSLHTRSGTRIYSKKVMDGKSELSLSKEEGEVLKDTLNRQ